MTHFPASEPDVRLLQDDLTDLRARVLDLIGEKESLQRLCDQLKLREARYARAIGQMLDTPAQSVASARMVGKDQWEVVMTTGAVWRRVTKVIDTPTEYRYVEEWMPRPAVPGSRAALAEAVADESEVTPPLHLLPGNAA